MTEPSGSPGPCAHASAVQTRAWRGLVYFGGALAFGVLVVPLIIWIVGHRTLGPYTHGEDPRGFGPLTLYGDYFSGLAHGWIGYWTVAAGPAVILMAARVWLTLLRRLPRD